jgi:hypothetical protein
MQYVEETCDAKIGGERRVFWKKRADGTKYRVSAVIGGERCTTQALVSRSRNGRTVRLCLAHLKN